MTDPHGEYLYTEYPGTFLAKHNPNLIKMTIGESGGIVQTNTYDALIVGAGPAGLFMARECCLKSPQMRVALIDFGSSVRNRRCHQIEQGECAKCNVCHVVHGVGGAGMYSDGKLSSYPAGSGLTDIVGSADEVNELNDYVLNAFKKWMGSQQVRSTSSNGTGINDLFFRAQKANLSVKVYDVIHAGSEGIRRYCEEIESKLRCCGLDIMTNTRVVDVVKKKDEFTVCCKGKNGKPCEYKTRNLIFATGKASGLFLREIMNKFGVRSDFNSIELGVRVEGHENILSGISDAHLDAKIKMDDTAAKVRSFCMCEGGFLVRCYYDQYLEESKICTISGFSYAGRKSDNSNFGILVRERFPKDIDPIRLHLSTVAAVNRFGEGGTVVQRLGDFIARQTTTKNALERNTVRTTLPHATPANLHWLLPSYVGDAVLEFIRRLGLMNPRIADADTLLHAPVWEMCWDRIEINENLETNVEGFYVIGDALGCARGIIQACISGVAAARSIIAKKTERARVRRRATGDDVWLAGYEGRDGIPGASRGNIRIGSAL